MKLCNAFAVPIPKSLGGLNNFSEDKGNESDFGFEM